MAEETKPKLKKKKKKQPNPLSCKKKKKKKVTPNSGASSSATISMNSKKSNIDGIQVKTIEKKTKRKRIKLPTHVKEMLLSK